MNLLRRIRSRLRNTHTLAGQDGGAWTEDTHQTLYPEHFDFGLADFMCREFQFTTVLEFGSGLGHMARYIVDRCPVKAYHCIEPARIRGRYRDPGNPRLFSVDIFSQSIPREMAGTYDLVCSIEVAEHVPRQKHGFLFDFLVRHASKWIVFSGARIGQGGHGHVAERHEDEWRAEFTRRGCRFEKERSAAIRNACDKKNINHRRNAMVFRVEP